MCKAWPITLSSQTDIGIALVSDWAIMIVRLIRKGHKDKSMRVKRHSYFIPLVNKDQVMIATIYCRWSIELSTWWIKCGDWIIVAIVIIEISRLCYCSHGVKCHFHLFWWLRQRHFMHKWSILCHEATLIFYYIMCEI